MLGLQIKIKTEYFIVYMPLKDNSGLSEPDVFPIDVVVVALCAMLTLLSVAPLKRFM